MVVNVLVLFFMIMFFIMCKISASRKKNQIYLSFSD